MARLSHESRSAMPGVKKWKALALLLVVLAVIAASAGVWLMTTKSALVWLGSAASHASKGKLTLEGLDGALSEEAISARAVRFESDNLTVIARDVRLQWRPQALAARRLEIAALVAGDVEIVSPPSPEPDSLPESLELPLAVSIRKLDIGSLRVLGEVGAKPEFAATELMASLESDGHTHHVSGLRTRLEFGTFSASGRLAGTKPFDLEARMELAGLAIAADKGSPETPEARISATLGGNLEQLKVKAEGESARDAGLTGNAEAELQPYSPLKIASLRLALTGLDPRAFSPVAPKADLALQADFRQTGPGRLSGGLTGRNGVSATFDQGGLPIQAIRAQAMLSTESVQFDELDLVMAGGGTISGTAGWQGTQKKATADLAVSRIDPARLDTRLRSANISGTIRLSGDENDQRGVVSLKDRKLQMDVVFVKAGDMLALEKMRLRHGRSSLAGTGEFGFNKPQPLRFEGSLQRFDISAFAQVPRTDLNATLKLAGELESEPENQPSGVIHFRMGNSQIAGQPVTGHGRVELARYDPGSKRPEGNGEIELRLGANRLAARGGFGRPGDKLELDLAAPALAQIRQGLGGSLNALGIVESSLAGLGQDGGRLPDMRFTVEGKGLTLNSSDTLATLAAEGGLRAGAIALKLSLTDYAEEAEIRLRRLDIEVEGSNSRHRLQAGALTGAGQNLALQARGGIKAGPRWQDAHWAGEVYELSGTGQLPFHLASTAALQVSSAHFSLGAANLAVAGGSVRIGGIEWTPRQWSSRGNFTRIGLRAHADREDSGSRGKQEEAGPEPLRLGGEWDIASTTQLKGSLRIARESGDWVLPGDSPFPLGLKTLELAANAGGDAITAELKAQGKHLGLASGIATVPVTRSDTALGWTVLPHAAIGGHISVNMEDISWAGAAFDNTNNLRTGGQLALEADLVGTLATPRLMGRIRGDRLALALLDQGVRLEQGILAARFTEDALHMETLDFTAPHQPVPEDPLLKHLKMEKGPGKLRASGVMDLAGTRGDLEITASLLPLAQRSDRWIIASGEGRATLENNSLTLRGRLAADAGLLAQPTAGRPHLPDDVIVIDETASIGHGQQQADRKGLRIRMEATLDLGNRFFIRASGLEGRLDGQLHLQEEPGQPLRATGAITARDTKFEAYGQNLTVERGIVNFQGPLDDPALNVLAVRKGLAVQAGVEVTGSVRQPKVRLVSTPNVPDLEKLSWITLGRAPGGKADASLLLAAAGSILGGQAGGVTEKITRTIGVDELVIRQSGVDALTGQVGVVGKRLSDKAYISYEQGLTAVAGVTKLTYNLTPKITLITRAGMDNAIDVAYTLGFD
jgi:translocation and assembly module TamB